MNHSRVKCSVAIWLNDIVIIVWAFLIVEILAMYTVLSDRRLFICLSDRQMNSLKRKRDRAAEVTASAMLAVTNSQEDLAEATIISSALDGEYAEALAHREAAHREGTGKDKGNGKGHADGNGKDAGKGKGKDEGKGNDDGKGSRSNREVEVIAEVFEQSVIGRYT